MLKIKHLSADSFCASAIFQIFGLQLLKEKRALKQDFTQSHEIRITGVSRSGNHAIINWITRQIEGNYCFLNCVEPKTNPYLTPRPLSEDGKLYETNIKKFDLSAEQAGNLSEKKFLVYNHEDIFLGPLNHAHFELNHDRWIGTSKSRKDVLILRDPFNLFASRMKAGLMRGHYTHHGARPISTATLIRIYKQHAREFLGERNILKNKVVINYNKWTQQREYREKVAGILEIPFSDQGFEEVKAVAGGSSFDGVTLSGKASSMKLHSRWEQYAEKDEFWELFDEELVNLSEQIFGETAAIKQWKERNFQFH